MVNIAGSFDRLPNFPTNPLVYFTFELDTNGLESTRQVFNIFDLLADMGGLSGSLLGIISVLIGAYQASFQSVE